MVGHTSERAARYIEPGHVYDLATIVVADLATLAVELDADGIAVEYAMPARVFPTHIYEIGGLLQAQLEIIDGML